MMKFCNSLIVMVSMSVAMLLTAPAAADVVTVGAGAYHAQPGLFDEAPPKAPYRTKDLLNKPARTNQWYSTLLFNAEPEPIYAIPLSFKATPAGFEMVWPGKEVKPTERQDVEIHYAHRAPLLITPLSFAPWPAKLAGAGDWSIDIAMGDERQQMLVTIAHGSAFAWFKLSSGDVRISLPTAGEGAVAADDPRQLGLLLNGKHYRLYGPSGVSWQKVSEQEWIGRLPDGAGYFSAAALPDDSPQTLQLFARHAYAFVTDTRVQWRYDQASSKVETTFNVQSNVMEGEDHGPLLGLYPHHWFSNAAVADKLGPAMESIRGEVRLLPASGFSTSHPYYGFVPYWPRVAAGERRDDMDDVMKRDKRNARRMMLEIGNGPYWQGKGLQRITQLMSVVEQQGDARGGEKLLRLVQKRMESWFDGDSSKTYFHLDKTLGSVIAYPEEYFSVQQMNDHHFHYGYWIRAAADVALRDPQWAARDNWGGMVDLLVADIATSSRDDDNFPFLRNFDPYEGHSWASGVGLGAWGNNQESSSEAVNAWAGLILWGEINGDKALRDLGVYLYATEITAINHYWFDIHGLVLAPEYMNEEVSMLFGGKYAHNTWWIDEPRQIHGINLLPIIASSTYLGVDPAFIKRNLDALAKESEIYASRGKRPDPPDIWQDLFAKYLALADPQAGLAAWDKWGAVEFGDTRSHTLHWLLSLQEMGAPALDITADTPFYAVFRKPDGGKTHLAFNAGKTAIKVTFSDGHVMQAAPGVLERSTSAAGVGR